MNNINLSLVIASYNGYKNIQILLNSILKNKYVPSEIIIVCHSEQYNKYKFYLKKYNNYINIIILKSKIKNQIFQRQKGLQKSSKKYIMQLDDDIIVSNNIFELIYRELKNNHYKIILCSDLYNFNKDPADIRWKKIYNDYFIIRLFLLILNKFKKIQPFTILTSGKAIPGFKNEILNYEWLNSSLCFHKSALKDYEFFFNKGKAFYEDVYTSHAFYIKGYTLKKIKNIKIYHPVTEPMGQKKF